MAPVPSGDRIGCMRQPAGVRLEDVVTPSHPPPPCQLEPKKSKNQSTASIGTWLISRFRPSRRLIASDEIGWVLVNRRLDPEASDQLWTNVEEKRVLPDYLPSALTSRCGEVACCGCGGESAGGTAQAPSATCCQWRRSSLLALPSAGTRFPAPSRHRAAPAMAPLDIPVRVPLIELPRGHAHRHYLPASARERRRTSEGCGATRRDNR